MKSPDKPENLGFEFDEKEVLINMCKAMDDNNKKREVTGAIKGMHIAGMSDNDIIIKTIENFYVTKEYVLELLALQKV